MTLTEQQERALKQVHEYISDIAQMDRNKSHNLAVIDETADTMKYFLESEFDVNFEEKL